MWTRLLRPARDDDGVSDSVLTLTAIILLLRPLDVWWLAPFVLAAACLSLARPCRPPRAAHVDPRRRARRRTSRGRLAARPTITSTCSRTGAWRSGWRSRAPRSAATLSTSSRWLLGACLRDGGALEGGAVARLYRRPLLPRDAADRRTLRRRGAGVRRAVARSDGRRTATFLEPLPEGAELLDSAAVRRAAAAARVRRGRDLGWAAPRGADRAGLPAAGARDGSNSARHAALLAFCVDDVCAGAGGRVRMAARDDGARALPPESARASRRSTWRCSS